MPEATVVQLLSLADLAAPNNMRPPRKGSSARLGQTTAVKHPPPDFQQAGLEPAQQRPGTGVAAKRFLNTMTLPAGEKIPAIRVGLGRLMKMGLINELKCTRLNRKLLRNRSEKFLPGGRIHDKYGRAAAVIPVGITLRGFPRIPNSEISLTPGRPCIRATIACRRRNR